MTNLPKMGVDSRLGVNSMLGTLKWDIGGKFRVKVGPLARDEFEKFLPGTDNIQKMKELVGGFLFDPWPSTSKCNFKVGFGRHHQQRAQHDLRGLWGISGRIDFHHGIARDRGGLRGPTMWGIRPPTRLKKTWGLPIPTWEICQAAPRYPRASMWRA